MATYFVATNGNDSTGTGSQLNPYLTLGKADSIALPGDTLYVRGGLYTASTSIVTTASGSTNQRILWKSYDGQGLAKLSGSMNNTDLWDSEGSFVDIDGFDFTGNLVKIGLSNWGHHCRIFRSSAHDVGNGLANTAAGAGFFDYAGITTLGQNEWASNLAVNCGPLGSSTCTTFHGFYISTKFAFVHDNISYNNSSWGILSGGLAGNNTFQDIANNTLFNNTFGGVKMESEDSATVDNNDVSNNISYGNGRLGITGTGFIDQGNIGTNNTYRNNCTFGNVGVAYSLLHATPTGSITADPQFVLYLPSGAGDYRVKATSPCIDAGIVTSPASLYDFLGVNRPQNGVFDVGAYEFVPVLANQRGGLSLLGA